MYVGFSSDLKQRIADHMDGKDAVTRRWRPLNFVYAEMYANKKDALQRERFFKSGWGKMYLKKILANTLKELKSSKI